MKHPDVRQHVQDLAQSYALWMLSNLGYDVHVGNNRGHQELIVDGTLTVAVRGAIRTAHRISPGRYQFNTRGHPDVHILHCFSTPLCTFVIPDHAIGERANIAIWSEDPYDTTGQWAKYCNAWHVVQAELERKKNRENHD